MRRGMKLGKLVPQQRFAKGCLAAVVLFLLLASAARLRHGSFELSSSLFDTDRPQADGASLFEPADATPVRPPVIRPPMAPGECDADMAFLRRPELELTDNILYSRRCVRPVWGSWDRNVVATEPGPLVSHTMAVNLTSCAAAESVIPCDPLLLQVPYPYPEKQYNHLIFGVASTFDRLNDSLPAFAHWLSRTGALLVAVAVDADDTDENGHLVNDLATLERAYSSHDVTARILSPRLKSRIGVDPEHGSTDDDNDKNNGDKDGSHGALPAAPVEQHHFMLIRDLLEHATPTTRWLAILDDDTFFPSLYPLDAALATYDADGETWLGTLSDNFDSIKLWGIMAFGGAGVFLSVPLARRLEPLLEQCTEEASIDTGDGMLRDCVYAHSHARLTTVPGLNQHDLRGDAAGIFEGGARPLSVHHWKSWYSEPMPAMAAVAGLCGDCFLQRWKFGNDVLLANGYSITQYRDGLDGVHLDQLEATWAGAPDRQFDFSYGPRRPRLDAGQKKSYKLRDVNVTERGDFRQIYVHMGDVEAGEIDEVIELLWEL